MFAIHCVKGAVREESSTFGDVHQALRLLADHLCIWIVIDSLGLAEATFHDQLPSKRLAMKRLTVLFAMIGLLAASTLVVLPFLHAVPPQPAGHYGPPGHEGSSLEALTVVTGKLTGWAKNEAGDFDGFTIEGESSIHFPPHHGTEVSQWLKPGDEVTVFATMKKRLGGEETAEAVVIQKGSSAKKIAGPPPKHDQHKPQEEPAAMSVSGKVTAIHENHDGNRDGFTVDDKTEVKFPPHESETIFARTKIVIGSQVTVDGRRHQTPKGDIHLHAERVSSGEIMVEIKRPEAKQHPSGPPHAKDANRKPHEQIISELKKIRNVLEEQGR